jgi:hypothetical protein
MWRVLLIVLGFALITCSEKKTEIPDSVIGKEKMTLMLTDLCLMEGAINVANINPANHKTLALKFNLYKQHNVTRQQFDSSLIYYCRHMDDFREIQAKVLEELNKKK